MRSFFRRLAAAVLLATAFGAFAADRQLVLAPTTKPPAGEKRMALVIGNGAYKSAPLRNPVNDARAIAKTLAATGFQVTVLEDATQETMFRAIRSFGDDLTAGGVGLFYYAGHGMQVRGRNFLIPVNADIQREDEIEFRAVDANFVVAKMDTAKNGLNMLILDACRNNPFARSFRSGSQGLAQMDAPSGTLIAFATSPGQVAADGDGMNGLYTKHLLENVSRPGLPVEQLFKEVRNGVARETGERQIPWESSSLRGNFFFVPARAGDAVLAAEERRRLEKSFDDRLAEQQRAMERMIQEMLARQRAELEASLKAPASAPPPAAAPAPAPAVKPAPVVAAVKPQPAPAPQPAKPIQPPKPAAVAAALAPRGYPAVGDSWEYRYVDTMRHRERRARYEVTGVAEQGIRESGGFTDSAPSSRLHRGRELALGEFWELAPYALAVEDAKPGEAWPTIPYAGYRDCQHASASCQFSGKIVGREKVDTPAGSFEALKVVVDFNGRGLPGAREGVRVWRQMTFWYAAEAKRIVKSTARTITGDSLQDDYDVELTSFRLGQGAPALLAAAADLVGTGIDDPRFPRIGDRWEYSYVDATSRRETRLYKEITAVSRAGIVESSRLGDADSAARAYAPGMQLVFREVAELSPYLLSFGAPKVGDAWPALRAENYRTCMHAGAVCRFDAKAMATEAIATAGGKFEALKLVVDMNARGVPGSIHSTSSNTVWRQFTFWYAPEAKRLVKSSARTLAGASLDADYDFELVSYQPAQARKPGDPLTQVASAAPTPSSTDPRLPRVGDRWEYRYADSLGRRQSRLLVEVTEVSAQGVRESGSFNDERSYRRLQSPVAKMVFGNVWDFLPYLLTSETPKPGAAWATIPFEGYPTCQFAGAVCWFKGSVAGNETVSTAAGKFEALKVVVDMNARGVPGSVQSTSSNTVWRQFTFWYAPEAKRFVKSSVRTLGGAGMDEDYDLELVSYKLN